MQHPGARNQQNIVTATTTSLFASTADDTAPNANKAQQEQQPTPPPSFVTSSLAHHHTAIKTRNITTAIAFYSLFDFRVEVKFRAGPARAAWLIHDPSSPSAEIKQKFNCILPPPPTQQSRIEIIEVPSYSLNEQPNQIKRSLDLIKYETALGLNHVALDVTECIRSVRAGKDLRSEQQQQQTLEEEEIIACDLYNLKEYLYDLNKKSYLRFGKTLRVAVEPTKQIIGPYVYELCFIYDADGALIELLHYSGITSAAEKYLESKNDDDEVTEEEGDWMRWGWEPWDGTGFVGSQSGDVP